MNRYLKVFSFTVNYIFILSLLYFISLNLITLILTFFDISLSLNQSFYIIIILLLTVLFFGFKFVNVKLF